MTLRILASVLLLFSVLFLPFWVSILLALAGMFYFSVFWETVVLFLLSDLLYGAGEAKFHGAVFVSFVSAIIVIIAIEIVKKKLKFYPNV